MIVALNGRGLLLDDVAGRTRVPLPRTARTAGPLDCAHEASATTATTIADAVHHNDVV